MGLSSNASAAEYTGTRAGRTGRSDMQFDAINARFQAYATMLKRPEGLEE